eukprot:2375468-Lingulodinium_polyedra.AAC.1
MRIPISEFPGFIVSLEQARAWPPGMKNRFDGRRLAEANIFLRLDLALSGNSESNATRMDLQSSTKESMLNCGTPPLTAA